MNLVQLNTGMWINTDRITFIRKKKQGGYEASFNETTTQWFDIDESVLFNATIKKDGG